MAQGLSTNWRTDGPTSRTAQATYLAQQARSSCTQSKPLADGSRPFCPRHAYRGCPVEVA